LGQCRRWRIFSGTAFEVRLQQRQIRIRHGTEDAVAL
jgi:hypothetical protein